MRLEIYLDPKDPLAYLALPGTARLLQQTNCEAHWFPMQVAAWADPGPEPPADAARGDRHRWFRANYRERELLYYAGVLQLPLTNLYRHADSSHAAMALLWLATQPHASSAIPEFLSGLTQAYWADPKASMDKASTLRLLQDKVTTDTTPLDEFYVQQGPAALTQQLQANVERGVIRGPAYRFADQLYIGREHLPLLAQLISE